MVPATQHTDTRCPLCADGGVETYWQGRRRVYLQCPRCRLVFVPPGLHLSVEAEKREYDRHQNIPGDAGYHRFLNRLCKPLQALLAPHSKGLDFGCGPGPALALMLEAAGHEMASFDPYYAPDPDAMATNYDFITATEVIEHLRRPDKDLARLWKILRPNGWLGLMTKQVINREAFKTWHYKNDATHICFYSRATFQWLANRWQAEVDFIGADVIIFHKNENRAG